MRSRTNEEHRAGTNSLSALNHQLPRLRCPANIQPQDAEGQRRVNRALRLIPIYSPHCKSRLPSLQQPARIDRPERPFQVNRIAQMGQGQLRKTFPQHSLQNMLIDRARLTPRRYRPRIALPANLRTRRTTYLSSDQKCSGHLLVSPETEYFACSKSNITVHSSITTAPRCRKEILLVHWSEFRCHASIFPECPVLVCDE